jgi:hypothetical protein
MRAARASLAVLLALATGAVGACGDDGDGDAATTSTVERTTTEGGGTDGPDGGDSASSTAPSTTTPGTGPPDLGETPPFHDDRASGSGCTPGAGELPDGWWYASSLTADLGAGTVTFDLACYYVGAAAEAEAASRGDEVDDDHYVVDDNPTLRTVPVGAGATASCVELGAGVSDVACEPSDIPDPETPWAVWLRVVGGEVDRLVEQYAP